MGIYDGLKDAAGILKEAGKIEQYRQILEVQEKLLEMQKQIADLENENLELKKKLEYKGKVKFDKNSYWIETNDGLDGPLCTRCWDADNKPIRMQPLGNPDYYACPHCDNKSVKVYSNHESPYVRRGPPTSYR